MRRLLLHERNPVRIHARGERADAVEADRVRRGLVVCRRDVDAIGVQAGRGGQQPRDELANRRQEDVEGPLVIEHLDRDRARAVGHHDRACTHRIGDVIVVAWCAGAATDEVAVPASILIAVEERIAGHVVAVVLLVDVRLLEGEQARTGVHAKLGCAGAVRRIGESGRRLLAVVGRGRSVSTAVRREARDRCPDAE